MNKNIIFVPYWIVEVLKRKSLSLKSILNYDIVREHISLDDLSSLLGFQQAPEIGSLKLTPENSLLSSWKGSASLRNQVELDSAVVPLSYSKEKEVLSRLRETGLEGVDVNNDNFRVVDIDRDAFAVIMYVGFFDVPKEKKEAHYKSLVAKLLSQSYVYCKIEEVSKTSLFKTYVDLLEVSTLPT